MYTANYGSITGLIASGKVRVLAVGAPKRLADLPDVPTLEELGIKGSSTTPLVLADAKTPVDNVLGEIGKGHKIAFNILNIGRFKLGAMCIGGMKLMVHEAVRYANERHQFGKSISSFGALRSLSAKAMFSYTVRWG